MKYGGLTPRSSRSELVVVSGHFNPLHEGHIDMMEAAARHGDLCVIVKNDRQQIEKKGRIVRTEQERLQVVSSLAIVGYALLAIDSDDTVRQTLSELVNYFPDRTVIFGNGGDACDQSRIPETAVCHELGIEMMVGLGGFEKVNSSSAINALLELE